MTDRATPQHLTPARCQLPVSWYFDPAILAKEQALMYEAGPKYVGHELMVPNAGDYRVLSWLDDAKVLVRNESGVELLSNICRHRQAILLEGHGNAQNIVCPLHRWTYDLKGRLIGAPYWDGRKEADLSALRRRGVDLKEIRSGVWCGRTPSAMSTGEAGGRRSSDPRSSTDAESAHWTSSSTRTSGLGSASHPRSSHAARWLR